MSELEKVRAMSFLSILTIALIVLFAVQARQPELRVPARETLEVCAASKGALCEDATLIRPHYAGDPADPAELGAMVVAAPHWRATTIASNDAPTQATEF